MVAGATVVLSLVVGHSKRRPLSVTRFASPPPLVSGRRATPARPTVAIPQVGGLGSNERTVLASARAVPSATSVRPRLGYERQCAWCRQFVSAGEGQGPEPSGAELTA